MPIAYKVFLSLQYGPQLKLNYDNVKQNMDTFYARDVATNPNFSEIITKHNEVVEKYSKTGHKIAKNDPPELGKRGTSMRESKSVGSKQNRNSTSSITSASSRSSMQSSGSSGSNRSPIKVVIPPPKSNLVVGSGLAAENSQMRPHSEFSPAPTNFHPEYVQSDMKQSHSASSLRDNEPVNVRMRADGVKSEENLERRGSKEAFENVPSCGLPSLPVTTKITKLITDQHALTGTLRKPSQNRKMRKSISTKMSDDYNDLPPPPPDPSMDEGEELPLPPPPEDFLMLSPRGSKLSHHMRSPSNQQPGGTLVNVTNTGYATLPNMGRSKPPVVQNQERCDHNGTLHNNQAIPPQLPQIVQQADIRAQQYNQQADNRQHHYMQQMDSPMIHQPMGFHQHHMNHGHVEVTSQNAPKSAPTTPKKQPPPVAPKKHDTASPGNLGNSPNHHHCTGNSATQNNTQLQKNAFEPSRNTNFFINDLQRVLNEKHSRFPALKTETKFPPEPPLPYQSRMDLNPNPNFDELPPPPAELLEGLKQCKKRPPPPPKRKV
jgi:hypothetical protein